MFCLYRFNNNYLKKREEVMKNILLKIAKQLYMQEIDKQILNFWNSEEVIVDFFIACA